MKSFDIYDHPDLIRAINHFVDPDYFKEIFDKEDSLKDMNCFWWYGWCYWPCFCGCCCFFIGLCLEAIKYKIDKLTFSNNADAALEYFITEVPNIVSLDLSHFELQNIFYRDDKLRFFLSKDVSKMIDYIISHFENSTTLKQLDLGACKLSSCDLYLESDSPLIPPRPLKFAIAEKIIRIPSLLSIRTLDKYFAETLKDLLNAKKSLLLEKLLGKEVVDTELGVNGVELSPLKNLIPSFPEELINIVGEHLSPEDIGIGPEIILE